MADLATNLPQIPSNSIDAATSANAVLDAGSPGTHFGFNFATSGGLIFGYLGGVLSIDGVLTRVANGTVTLTASATNYVEMTRAGVVSSNTTGFTAGRIPLFQCTTNSIVVTNRLDVRMPMAYPPIPGRLQKAMTDANQTLTAAEARNRILRFTGALTANRNIVVPLAEQEWIVNNATTGGFALQFIGPTGTGVSVASARHAIIYSDGINVNRVTPDQA
jgi:hypothetical protein